MKVLGVNAIFHDSSAALVVDGVTVAAAEEERFSRRRHGKRPVPLSAWELPEQAMAWCLAHAGVEPSELDMIAYAYDPDGVNQEGEGMDPEWEQLRTTYARRAPLFLRSALPGLDPFKVRFVRHHVAHAASAALAAPFDDAAVLVVDGRGESTSHLAGQYADGKLVELASQELPHSLGLFYGDATVHLGFTRSSDESKVMALAAYGSPKFLPELSEAVYSTGDGGFRTEPVDWDALTPKRRAGEEPTAAHADLAASVQARLEEVTLDLVRWVHDRTGQRDLALAGEVALNCALNTRLHDEGPFDRIWVQPVAGDAGTALGAALHLANELGDKPKPVPDTALGRGWNDEEIEEELLRAGLRYRRPTDLGGEVAAALAADEIVGWFQGRSEFGPSALGQRSLLAHPGHVDNLERLNAVKGRESFRPISPMVLADRAGVLFARGPQPSPYMLFVHDVDPEWRDRIPAVTHVDGTARIQTVDRTEHPLMGAVLAEFEHRTGLPAVINTGFNTAGRPMVDHPRDALECFGSAPIDLLALGPFTVRRT